MKIKEIVSKKDADLKKKIAELNDKLAKLRMKIATKEANNYADVKKIKKDIARIKTILREREIQRKEENEKKA